MKSLATGILILFSLIFLGQGRMNYSKKVEKGIDIMSTHRGRTEINSISFINDTSRISNNIIKKLIKKSDEFYLQGGSRLPLEISMNMVFMQVKSNLPKSKLFFIDKEEMGKYPWIVFVIELSDFKAKDKKEKHLWYIIQGEKSLYANSMTLNKTVLISDLKYKWGNLFK